MICVTNRKYYPPILETRASTPAWLNQGVAWTPLLLSQEASQAQTYNRSPLRSFGSWHAFSPQNTFFPLRKWLLLRAFPLPFKKPMKSFFRKRSQQSHCGQFHTSASVWMQEAWPHEWDVQNSLGKAELMCWKSWNRQPTLGLGKQRQCFMEFQYEEVCSWLSLSSNPGVCALLSAASSLCRSSRWGREAAHLTVAITILKDWPRGDITPQRRSVKIPLAADTLITKLLKPLLVNKSIYQLIICNKLM